ncbi:hypothetical protein OF83DRAFT_1177505 [Amylostereum chailletii]|nr:hypothetical protein OF83DRAFT_1177505 [Amylostereum chailletii]
MAEIPWLRIQTRFEREMVFTRLPPELWLIIFKMATDVPGILDPDITDPFDEPEPAGLPAGDSYFVGLRHQTRSVRASVRVKSTISRVCQQWHALVIPILYQTLYISRNRHVTSLDQIIWWSIHKLGRSYGTYTRRLDIALPREKVFRDSLITIHLIDLIRNLPKLEINTVFLNSRAGTRIPPVIAYALRDTSLRHLRWDCSTIPWDFRSFLEGSPHLRTVLVKEQTMAWPLGHHVQFASLYEDARNKLDGADKHMPSLRQVYIHRLYSLTAQRIDNLTHLFSTSCPNLRTVYILYDMTTFTPILSILGHCPSIQHIIVIFSHRGPFPRGLTLPSSTTHFGLFFRFDEGSRKSYRDLQECLTTMEGPGLRAVRLLNRRGVDDWRERHTNRLRECLSKLEGYPWRLEDHCGQPLAVPTQ